MLIISFLLILNLHWSLGEKIIIEQLNAEFNSYVLRSIDNFFFITAALELMTYISMSLILIDNYSNRIQLGLDTLMLILTIRLYGDYTTKVKVIGKYLR